MTNTALFHTFGGGGLWKQSRQKDITFNEMKITLGSSASI
jgi:hypothetical protein